MLSSNPFTSNKAATPLKTMVFRFYIENLSSTHRAPYAQIKMSSFSESEDVPSDNADYNRINRHSQPGQTPISHGQSLRHRNRTKSTHVNAASVSVRDTLSAPVNVMTSEDEESVSNTNVSCCVSFWGPFKPYIGGHSVRECAESTYLPTIVLFVYRLLAFLFILSVDIYMITLGLYKLQYYTILSSALITITFFILALSSFLVIINQSRILEATHIANILIPIHFIAGASSIYLTPVYYIILNAIYFSWFMAVLHGGTLLLFVIDFLLGAAMVPRLFYVFLFFLFNLAYLAFVWIRHAIYRNYPDYNIVYPFFEHWDQSIGFVIGLYVALVLGTIIVGFLAFLITRITFCFKTSRNRK